jgi:glutathione S-transferase
MTAPHQLQVYWISGSPFSWRVMLTLEVKGLAYTARLLEVSKGDTKKPEFLALNPRGKVPVLRHGDVTLAESLAIMAYLDREYPEPALFGRSARDAGGIWRLISEYQSYQHGPIDRIVRPIYFGKTAEQADDIRAAIPEVHAELARLEAALGDSPWLSGGSISAADIAIYPFLKSLLRAAGKDTAVPFALGLLPFAARYPRLAAWMERVERIPGYDRTYPPHWRQ